MALRQLLLIVMCLILCQISMAEDDMPISGLFGSPPPCDVFAGFSIGQYPLCKNDMLLFINSSWNAFWYEWSINDSVFSNDKHPDLKLTKPGVHKIMLVAGDYKCTDTSEMWIDVNESYITMVSAMMCPGKEYDFFGTKLTTAGYYATKLMSLSGCDSIIELYLEVDSLKTGFTYSGGIAIAGSGNTYYQWMLCKNGLTPVQGANSHIFQPLNPGLYALVTSNGVCTDTSECVKMGYTDIGDIQSSDGVALYPNPAKEHVRFSNLAEGFTFEATLISPDGRQRLLKSLTCNDPYIDLRGVTPGIYIVRLNCVGRFEFHRRLVVE